MYPPNNLNLLREYVKVMRIGLLTFIIITKKVG